MVNVDDDSGKWEGLLTLPRLADVFGRDGDKFVAVPDGLVLLGKRELALRGGGWIRREPRGQTGSVSGSRGGAALTNSPPSLGTRTFISELLALMTSQPRESLLRYTWQPSVLLMEMVGTLPKT